MGSAWHGPPRNRRRLKPLNTFLESPSAGSELQISQLCRLHGSGFGTGQRNDRLALYCGRPVYGGPARLQSERGNHPDMVRRP